MFPNASDLSAGWPVTQVCARAHEHGGPMKQMHHKPLGFVRGAFKAPQLNWLTVNKEGYVIAATSHGLQCLQWRRVQIYCDHPNHLEECK